MDEGSATAGERDLRLDVIEHIAGPLKLAMGRYFFELIGREPESFQW